MFTWSGKFHIVTFIFFGLTACTAASSQPEILNHPAPDLLVTQFPYTESGCIADESGNYQCADESLLGSLGCDYLSPAGDYLGGLEPGYPLTFCLQSVAHSQMTDNPEYIYRDGCLLARYVKYAIKTPGGFEVIDSLEELQNVYAPITSENEALSFAIAATGLSAYYDFVPPIGFRYFVSELEDSHVIQVEEGYKVYLYDYKLCGCGPHTTEYVEILVTWDGQIEEMGRVAVYEDPEQDTLCID